MYKKAQAAMEFLMTYGWAILVVLIAIGALAYFGVLNPSKFLPESCTIGTGVSCDDFKVTGTTATIRIRNGMGDQLSSVRVDIVEQGAQCTPNTGLTIADGNVSEWSCTVTAGTLGSKYKGTLRLNYTTSGGLAHSKSGALTTKYE